MISRTLPKAKKPTWTAQPHATARRRTSPMGRIAHELMNQLTVLNLVGHDILSANGTGPSAKLARDNEIFGRAIHEATLLAEQLADHLASQQDEPCVARSRTIPDQGQVVRLLRSLPQAGR